MTNQEEESQFSPGPWNFHGDHITTAEIRSGDTSIAGLFFNGHNIKHGMANARLIAAAPELLEALQLIFPHAARRIAGTYEGEPILEKARLAIEKALGGGKNSDKSRTVGDSRGYSNYSRIRLS